MSSVHPTPLDGADLLLADLDGVIYKGAEAIPYAVESINRAAEGMRVGYVTNNASRTDASVAEHLRQLGLAVEPSDVVTSPQAAVRLLAGLVPEGSTVLTVGGEGLTFELVKAGFVPTASALDNPAAVIQGFATDVGWEQLAEASFALHSDVEGGGIPWVATNTDWTIPVARGIAPGNGTLVSAVHSAVGRLPVVAGKPEVAIYQEAVRRFDASSPLFIGDRLDTDILGSNRAGIPAVFVLTGVDGAKQLLAADERSRPRYILDDLRGLHEAYPETTSADGRFQVGGAVVRMRENRVDLKSAGSRIDLVRAATAAIWGSGLAIYGIDVSPELMDALGISR
ncbi:HAD-IIA family hydrolase [Parafrigoribacterium soli]|uniref:HAD-IIA family hydrolase n=1 Tax=Parafrigoribacterium soli TaxID=3144663 RepID=UPI0032EEAE58